jgi:hypothetical protein
MKNMSIAVGIIGMIGFSSCAQRSNEVIISDPVAQSSFNPNSTVFISAFNGARIGFSDPNGVFSWNSPSQLPSFDMDEHTFTFSEHVLYLEQGYIQLRGTSETGTSIVALVSVDIVGPSGDTIVSGIECDPGTHTCTSYTENLMQQCGGICRFLTDGNGCVSGCECSTGITSACYHSVTISQGPNGIGGVNFVPSTPSEGTLHALLQHSQL